MGLIFFLKGLVIGFAMAIPIGPVGILCLRKTLTEGSSRGLITGLGAATVDALFGSIGAFGLTFVSAMVARQELWVRLVGGMLLLFLGIRTLRAKRKDPILPFGSTGLLGSFLSAFVLALTNPVTIFAFIAVFAAFGLGKSLSIVSASELVLGVFIGSCLWFLTLSIIAKFFRKKLNSGGFRWVNRIAGALLLVCGAASLISLI
jgi:threonine/homoserine/homoserine lactone efflux protein